MPHCFLIKVTNKSKVPGFRFPRSAYWQTKQRVPFHCSYFIVGFCCTIKQKNDLIFFERVLSVSYNRVLQLSTDIGSIVITIDNFDHNPTSTLALTAFQGTAVSLTQRITDETTESEFHLNQPLLWKTGLSSVVFKYAFVHRERFLVLLDCLLLLFFFCIFS